MYDDCINDAELLLTDDDGDTDSVLTTITVQNSIPKASVHTAYIPVNINLRLAGERGHNIRLEVFEGSTVTDYIEFTGVPGNPDDQAQEQDMEINISEDALVRIYFTPGDDPVKGHAKGATPGWVDLNFEDGTTTTLFRSFNVNKQDDWVWEIDLGPHLVGQKVHFQGTVYDPGMDDLTVTLDFGDGTIFSNYYPYDGYHPVVIEDSAEHTFTKFKQYTMTFSAEDDDGGIGTDTLLIDNQKDGISADNVAPQAFAFSDKVSVNEDEELEFFGKGVDTPSDIGFLEYYWDFGDGNTALTDTTTNSYETECVYTVLLKVTDDSGVFGVDFVEISVANRPPVAIISHPTTSINEDDTIIFDASSSLDTPRDIPKLRYAWDFGDGSKGYGITTSHVYTNCGVYTATLTVQDDNGEESTDSVQITLNNAVPYNLNIIAKTEVVQDELIFFTGSALDKPSDEPLLTYEWDFGDSTIGNGRKPTHSYTSPGLYTVQLTVTDDDLSFSSYYIQINVENVDPVAYAGTSSMKLYGPEMTLEFNGRGFDTFSDQSSLVYTWKLDGSVIGFTPDTTVTFSSTGVYELSFEVVDTHWANSNTENIIIDFTLDSDGDMVTDEYELVLGTDPYLCDTDSDNLLDYMEVYDYPTDPLMNDTDSDSLNDWYEITNFGVSDPDEDGLSNPVDWDSDGEWIMDGVDPNPLQYNDVDGSVLLWDAIKVRNDIGAGVSAVMYGGTCFSEPTISEVSSPAPVSGDIGIFVEISSSCTPPGNSQIRIRYDESALPSDVLEANLALCEWFPAEGLWKRAEETGVDTTHNFVWAKVTHFSIFAVMDTSQLDSDGDGLKDGYELTEEYDDLFYGVSLNSYTYGKPLDA